MLTNLLSGGDTRQYIITLLLRLPIVLLMLSVHETAHGYVAYKLGDPTARNLGRLTLNPIKHLDPLGFISMILFGIGWANPVPINTRNFKNPRRDMALSGAAGPVSNLLLAVVFAILLKISYTFLSPMTFTNETSLLIANLFLQFLIIGIQINITFAVFNLIPVPPFDGSRIFYVFLPPKYYFGVMKYERTIGIVLLALLFLGVLDPVLNFFTGNITNLLLTLVGF